MTVSYRHIHYCDTLDLPSVLTMGCSSPHNQVGATPALGSDLQPRARGGVDQAGVYANTPHSGIARAALEASEPVGAPSASGNLFWDEPDITGT